MRLIDADALKKLRHDYIQGRIKFDGNEYDLIDKCPTIKARPVRHGRWRSKGLAELECTICKYIDVSKRYSNYCPNCGNPMDGGVSDD